jgi:hypothetical protein
MPENIVRPRNMELCRFPVDFFIRMFGWDNLELLCSETNIQRVLEDKSIPIITMEEIRATIGILLYMSVVSMPNIRLFWKKSMNVPAVSKVTAVRSIIVITFLLIYHSIPLVFFPFIQNIVLIGDVQNPL